MTVPPGCLAHSGSHPLVVVWAVGDTDGSFAGDTGSICLTLQTVQAPDVMSLWAQVEFSKSLIPSFGSSGCLLSGLAPCPIVTYPLNTIVTATTHSLWLGSAAITSTHFLSVCCVSGIWGALSSLEPSKVDTSIGISLQMRGLRHKDGKSPLAQGNSRRVDEELKFSVPRSTVGKLWPAGPHLVL